MMRAVKAELLKLLHTPGGMIGTIMWILAITLIHWQTLNNIADGNIDPAVLAPDHAFAVVLPAMAFFGPLLVPLIGAAIIGQEFRYGTWSALLTHGGSRLKVFTAKIGALAAVTFIWAALGLGIGYAVNLSYHARFVLPPLSVLLAKQIGVVTLGLWFFGLLSIAVAATFRSATAGVIVGLGLPWAEIFLADISGVRPWLPFSNHSAVTAIIFANVPTGIITMSPNSLSPTPTTALLTLLLEMTLFILWGAYAVRRTTQG